MRILISGASGFIGAPLVSFLSSQGHEVVTLSRSLRQGSVFWDPERSLVPFQFLEGFDAVIHLSGEPLSISRWTKKKKDRISKSRAEGTSFLSDILGSFDVPPKIFICASAVGFYGDRREELLDEESPEGVGFLPSVCLKWEEACGSLKRQGTRVVNTRFGVVLGKGGALRKIETFYKCGLGATLGTGRQWMSWIALDDLLQGMEHVLHSDLEGPVNFVSPNPIRQEAFSRLLAKTLHRPHVLKIPARLLRLVLGDAAKEMLLPSVRVNPSKLLKSGFTFKSPMIQDVFHVLYPE